ncbi:MAG TPA: hypothetical protein PK880_15705 [Candidatus Competibacter sp.]|nr:hypothetical protein [Candidatus Competibacteraceae bacterium]HRC73954.1 hypothetical protein [Candidatus Competibacter sp.]
MPRPPFQGSISSGWRCIGSIRQIALPYPVENPVEFLLAPTISPAASLKPRVQADPRLRKSLFGIGHRVPAPPGDKATGAHEHGPASIETIGCGTTIPNIAQISARAGSAAGQQGGESHIIGVARQAGEEMHATTLQADHERHRTRPRPCGLHRG